MSMDIDNLTAHITDALDEAEQRLADLRQQKLMLSGEIKVQVEALARLRKLARAVTPRDQNGPHE